MMSEFRYVCVKTSVRTETKSNRYIFNDFTSKCSHLDQIAMMQVLTNF